jgi:hypothetical protein
MKTWRIGLLPVVLLLAGVPWYGSDVLIQFGINALLLAVLAQGWNIIGGYTDYASFGNSVFYGLGGYGVAIAMVQWQLPFSAGLVFGVVLEIYPTEIVALLGSIVMNGRELVGVTPDQVFSLGLVQVPEGRQLFNRMSVQDNLLMGSYRRQDKAAITRDLDKTYAIFPRLAERRRQLAGSMSGGEQQMCAMARALMAAPVLMMVDATDVNGMTVYSTTTTIIIMGMTVDNCRDPNRL